MDDKKQVEVLSDTPEEIDVLSFDEPVTQNDNEVLTFDDIDTLEPATPEEEIDVLSEEPTITISVQPSIEPIKEPSEPIINDKISLDANIILEPAKNQVIRKEPKINENVEEFKIAEPVLNENMEESNIDAVLEEAEHHEPTDNTIELYVNDIYKEAETVTAPDLLANPSNTKESSTDPGYNSYGKEKKKPEKTNPKTTATSIFLFVLLLVAVSGFIAYEYLVPKKNNSNNNGGSNSSNLGTVNTKTVTCTYKSADIKLTKVLIYNDSLREVTEVRYTYSLDPNADPTTLKTIESNIYLALLYLPTDFETVQNEEGVTYDYNASVDKISVSFMAKRSESSSDLLLETIFGEYLDATVSDIVQDAKEAGLTCSIE